MPATNHFTWRPAITMKTGTPHLYGRHQFKFGKGVKFVLVPMGSVVFGNTNGLAPGLEIEITYKKFDFYSESEYVFDFSSRENNFFYDYSELAITPIDALRMVS